MPSKNKKSKNSKRQVGKRMPGNMPLVAQPPPGRRALMTYGARLAQSEAAAGVGTSYFFRLNSVYDPDYTGVGTVAIPYNTWSASYLNYKVHRVTMRIAASYSAGSAGTFAFVTLAPVAYQAVIPTNTTTWKMLPFAKSMPIPLAANGGRNIADLVVSWEIHKVARITREQYAAEADWSGQIGSNPARVCFGGVMFEPVGSALAGTIIYEVNMTYEVEWWNPVPMQ